MHSGEQFFPVFVDETDVCKIYEQRGFSTRALLPALVQFIDTRPRELPFEEKPRCCRLMLSSNSDHREVGLWDIANN